MAITQQEALDCFASDDLIGIGMEADAIRRALHPENVVTYAVPRAMALGQPLAELLSSIQDCVRAGDTTIRLTCAPTVSFAQVEGALTAIRRRFPGLCIESLSTGEVLALAASSGLDLDHFLTRLRVAGLDSISGDDLCARPTPASKLVPLVDWLRLHRLAHHAGIASTAGLVFGSGETSEERVHHLFAVRALQAETGGFTSFTLLPPGPGSNTELEPPTAVEYLRTLAIARIVLDNISSIESPCFVHGLKVVQMALRFGANDAGPLCEPSTTAQAAFTEEDLRRVIRDAGFIPVERDPLYRTLFLNN